MQSSGSFSRARALRRAAAVLLIAAAAVAWRGLLLRVLSLALGGWAIAFLSLPLARCFERRLGRSAASLAGLAGLIACATALLWVTLPVLARDLTELSGALPRSLTALNGWLRIAADRAARLLPGVSLPALDLESALPAIPDLAAGTLSLVAGIAGAAGRVSMTVILGFFFLRDREDMVLRLELLLPSRIRPMAVGMACAAGRELRLYLRAQLLIALAVGLTAAGALVLLRQRSALVLGLLVGLMNMIPYFGPIIGGAPAVLLALADGPRKALLVAAALCLVQQLDGAVISPRIMGSVTGLSPALVLVALFAGAQVAGPPGMLLAVPALIVLRALFRVFGEALFTD